MKIKYAASLLLSSVFVLSIAQADKLSDAYQGIMPDSVTDDASFKTWHAKTVQEFGKRVDKSALLHDQLERFFAPYTRKGSNEMCHIANAMCDYTGQRAQGKIFQKALFEGLKPEFFAHKRFKKPEEGRKIGEGMGEIRPYGVHAAFLKEVADLSTKIDQTKKEIEDKPVLKDRWKQEIVANRESQRVLEEDDLGLQTQKAENNSAIKSAQEEIEIAEKLLLHPQEEMKNLVTMVQDPEKTYERECCHYESVLQKIREEVSLKKEEIIRRLKGEEAVRTLAAQENKTTEPLNEELMALAQEEMRLEDLLKHIDEEYQRQKTQRSAISLEIAQRTEGIEALKEKKRSLEQKIPLFEKQTEEAGLKIKAHGQVIEELTEKIDGVEGDLKNLHSNLQRFGVERQKAQDSADAHALIKYFTFLNLYAALPNDDFGPHENFDENDKLSTLSSAAVPLIVEHLNKMLSKAVREAAEGEVSKFVAAITQGLANNVYNFGGIIGDILENNGSVKQYMYNTNSWSSSMGKTLANQIRDTLTSQTLINSYKKGKPNLSHYPAVKPTVENFYTQNEARLDFLRADHLLRETMNKWRAKVTISERSLMQRLGLDGAFFNPDFTVQTYPTMLSFRRFQEEFKPQELEELSKNAKEKNVWELGRVQLQLTFFNGLIAKEAPKYVEPIHRFVEQKIAAQPKAADHVRFEKAPDVQKAYLKYISYRNMSYALKFNGKGEVLSTTLKMIDPVLQSFLKIEISQQNRLDNVFAGKAFKWGQRVLQHGRKFIEAEGLEAHTFVTFLED